MQKVFSVRLLMVAALALLVAQPMEAGKGKHTRHGKRQQQGAGSDDSGSGSASGTGSSDSGSQGSDSDEVVLPAPIVAGGNTGDGGVGEVLDGVLDEVRDRAGTGDSGSGEDGSNGSGGDLDDVFSAAEHAQVLKEQRAAFEVEHVEQIAVIEQERDTAKGELQEMEGTLGELRAQEVEAKVLRETLCALKREVDDNADTEGLRTRAGRLADVEDERDGLAVELDGDATHPSARADAGVLRKLQARLVTGTETASSVDVDTKVAALQTNLRVTALDRNDARSYRAWYQNKNVWIPVALYVYYERGSRGVCALADFMGDGNAATAVRMVGLDGQSWQKAWNGVRNRG